jgi:hypothetical protein
VPRPTRVSISFSACFICPTFQIQISELEHLWCESRAL